MEWLSALLTQEPVVLFLSISIVVTVFIVSARKAHLSHQEKLKKLNDSFKVKPH